MELPSRSISSCHWHLTRFAITYKLEIKFSCLWSNTFAHLSDQRGKLKHKAISRPIHRWQQKMVLCTSGVWNTHLIFQRQLELAMLRKTFPDYDMVEVTTPDLWCHGVVEDHLVRANVNVLVDVVNPACNYILRQPACGPHRICQISNVNIGSITLDDFSSVQTGAVWKWYTMKEAWLWRGNLKH